MALIAGFDCIISMIIRLLLLSGIFAIVAESMFSYMTDEGFDLLGHDMRSYQLTSTNTCKRLCGANCGCLAFVRYHNGTCLLKSMSLDAGVVNHPGAAVGFCIDPHNPERDYVYEHQWIGTDLHARNGTTLFECADLCPGVVGASLYSWRNDGLCVCKADFKRISKQFGYTSGFLTEDKSA